MSDDLRAASCDGKAAYDRATAQKLARKANARRRTVRYRARHQTAGTSEDRIPALRAYQCPACRRWHVGEAHPFGRSRAELIAAAEARAARTTQEEQDV